MLAHHYSAGKVGTDAVRPAVVFPKEDGHLIRKHLTPSNILRNARSAHLQDTRSVHLRHTRSGRRTNTSARAAGGGEGMLNKLIRIVASAPWVGDPEKKTDVEKMHVSEQSWQHPGIPCVIRHKRRPPLCLFG